MEAPEKTTGITPRERALMAAAMKSAEFYSDVDEWLGEIISDGGHTVEQHLLHDIERTHGNQPSVEKLQKENTELKAQLQQSLPDDFKAKFFEALREMFDDYFEATGDRFPDFEDATDKIEAMLGAAPQPTEAVQQRQICPSCKSSDDFRDVSISDIDHVYCAKCGFEEKGRTDYEKYASVPAPVQSVAEIKADAVYDAAHQFINKHYDIPGGQLTPRYVFDWMLERSSTLLDSAHQDQREGE